MLCPRCGAKNPETAAFCMQCGQQLAAAQPVAGAATLAPGVQRKAIWPWLTGGLALMAALLVFLAKGRSLELVDKTAPAANLKVVAKAPLEVKMPQDVLDWLEHLRKIEARKNELSIKQEADMKTFEIMLNTLGPGIGQFDPSQPEDQVGDKEPADVTKGKFEDLRPQWEGLIKDFESKPPPAECKPIADDYFAGLSEVPGMISDLEDLMNQVNSDPQAALIKAQGLQSKSYRNIDENFAKTDVRVQTICDKYHVKKWFNIGERGGMFAKPDALSAPTLGGK